MRSRPHRLVHDAASTAPGSDRFQWSELPEELLREILIRVEAKDSGDWPSQRSVVACSGACRVWRLLMKEIVAVPELSSKLTFPISLKQTRAVKMLKSRSSNLMKVSSRATQGTKKNALHNGLDTIPMSVLEPRGAASIPIRPFFRSHSKPICSNRASCSDSVNNNLRDPPLVLSNKTPRWHEQLRCWCLNFHGRVTVASVKNFQLVAVRD